MWHYQLTKPILSKANKDQLHYITSRVFSGCFLSKATYSNSYIHSSTDAVTAMQAHEEQFGVQSLAQGHFDMQTRGNEPATF